MCHQYALDHLESVIDGVQMHTKESQSWTNLVATGYMTSTVTHRQYMLK